VKIQHTYTSTLQTNAYILNIWLIFYATSAV